MAASSGRKRPKDGFGMGTKPMNPRKDAKVGKEEPVMTGDGIGFITVHHWLIDLSVGLIGLIIGVIF
jgi:hypothetical protein